MPTRWLVGWGGRDHHAGRGHCGSLVPGGGSGGITRLTVQGHDRISGWGIDSSVDAVKSMYISQPRSAMVECEDDETKKKTKKKQCGISKQKSWIAACCSPHQQRKTDCSIGGGGQPCSQKPVRTVVQRGKPNLRLRPVETIHSAVLDSQGQWW